MTGLSTTTKVGLGFKAAKTAVTHPRATRRGGWLALRGGRVVARGAGRIALPLARRRARSRAAELGDTVRSVVRTVAMTAPPLAREVCETVQPPERPRTTRRLAAGFVLGAGAMYLLEPEQGAAHRAKLRELVAG